MPRRRASLCGTQRRDSRRSAFTFATFILVEVFPASCVKLVVYLCLIDLKKPPRVVYLGGW